MLSSENLLRSASESLHPSMKVKPESEDSSLEWGASKPEEDGTILTTNLNFSDTIPGKPHPLKASADRLLERFLLTRSESDINNCIVAYTLAVQYMTVDKAEFMNILHDAGVALLERYNLKEDLSDISQAISNLEIVVNTTANGHKSKPERLNNLGISLRCRFERTGDAIDIYKAISFHQQAISLTPDGHEGMPLWLNSLGISLMRRFESTGHRADIDDAVSSQEEAIRLTPDGHERIADILNGLGNSFLSRFESTGDLTDIYEAIESHRKANELTPDGHPDMPRWLNSLGLSLMRRFEAEGDLTDIEEAISFHKQAVQLTPDGHPDMAGRLNNLGNSFLCRFEWIGDLADVDESISSHRKALSLTPQDHADMPMWMGSLGNSLVYRFEHTDDVSDISEAISWLGQAVNLTPPEHASMPIRLNSLGVSFSRRFERTGDTVDISKAISSHQKAVHLSHEDHTLMLGMLSNLGLSFMHRYERTRDVTDISEAILYYQKGIHISEGHRNMSTLLNNLGDLLRLRFERTRDLADISQAISLQESAIALTPDGHVSKQWRLNNLGSLLMRRFEQTGDLTNISNAISYQQESVNVIPEGRVIPARFNNLGNSLLCRFEVGGELADIEEAVLSHQKAIDLTPKGHADMPMWLNSLGLSLRRRFERTHHLVDIQQSISNYRQGAAYDSGPPLIRLNAAMAWAELSQKFDPSQLLEAYGTAIHLLSQVAGLEQTVQSRHNNLLYISNISACAAAAAFDARRPELALEWLEQGRCLVWNQISSLRTPVDDLRTYDEALANDFTRVSGALEHSGARSGVENIGVEASMDQKMSLQEEAEIHVKLAHEMNQLLDKVRSIPEFRNFLRPPQAALLLDHLPSSGCVIVINVHQDRCDALALLPGNNSPLHIPLETFTYQQADELYKQLRQHLASRGVRMPIRQSVTGIHSGTIIHHILKELWVHVVKPIVDSLGITLSVSQDPHRIWWCTSGPLAFLPIHAAGNYNKHSPNSAICLSDFVISSYTPTVTSLTEKVKRNRKSDMKPSKNLLMISQANTPDLAPIPGTVEEIKTIREMLRKKAIGFQCLEESMATLKQVTADIELYSSIHFACHAIQDPIEPLQSGFHLHDGRFKLSELLRKNLPNADFAFLSACQTSAGDEVLPEEAVHLAAGMLAAGYQGVVATMWSIKDWYAPKVAEHFYSYLLARGTLNEPIGITNEGAARALYDTLKAVREDFKDSEDSLLVWLPYVHFGL